MNHYLSIILFTPLAGALVLLLINKQNENAIRWVANIFAFAGFLISVPLLSGRRGSRQSGPTTFSASTA